MVLVLKTTFDEYFILVPFSFCKYHFGSVCGGGGWGGGGWCLYFLVSNDINYFCRMMPVKFKSGPSGVFFSDFACLCGGLFLLWFEVLLVKLFCQQSREKPHEKHLLCVVLKLWVHDSTTRIPIGVDLVHNKCRRFSTKL